MHRTGRRPARPDARVPRFSVVAGGLPEPPLNAVWYADIPTWGGLGNFDVGDCVIAAAMHQILQANSYRTPGKAPQPTDQEAISAYSAITGYNPEIPGSDQGIYVQGQGGLIEYWTKHGLMCGGVLNKPDAVIQLTHPDPRAWRQAIHTFGHLLVGMRVPKILADNPVLPFVWEEPSTDCYEHEVLFVGYETMGNLVLYDFVSWGALYRMTESFAKSQIDETHCVFNGMASLDARGIDPAGIDRATLIAYMNRLTA